MKQKDNKKISLILGARQVGKTTVLKGVYENLSEDKKNRCLFLDLDIFTNFEKVSTFENLVNTLKLNGYNEQQKSFFYLFLDEFQRYEDISIILKNIYDNFNNIKIYASGSSSLKIKNAIQESLAGRKKVNIMYPLDFEEFLGFIEKDDLLLQLNRTKNVNGEKLDKIFSDLLTLLNQF